jgi:hypothetical protein
MYSSATLLLVLAALAQSASAASVQQLAQGGQCLTVSMRLICLAFDEAHLSCPFQVANPSGGAAVTLAACNSANTDRTSTGQQWVIQEGNNQGVKLFGTDYCLDAQTNPAPGRPALVYPCTGTAAQTWVS